MKKKCMSSLILDSRPYYGQSIFYMYTHIYKLKKVKLTYTLNPLGKKCPETVFYSLFDSRSKFLNDFLIWLLEHGDKHEYEKKN